ncbi:hypothetical protein BDD12DRAFT_760482, partial [Trichophaea hybrida]
IVISFIARKAGGLPNTLLELNVVARVVVTVMVYSLWWYKPLAVAEPILLSRSNQTYAGEGPGKSNLHEPTPGLSHLTPDIVAGIAISSADKPFLHLDSSSIDPRGLGEPCWADVSGFQSSHRAEPRTAARAVVGPGY